MPEERKAQKAQLPLSGEIVQGTTVRPSLLQDTLSWYKSRTIQTRRTLSSAGFIAALGAAGFFLSQFDQVRPMGLMYSRLMLGGLWLMLSLAVLIIIGQLWRRKMGAILVSCTFAFALVVVLDLIAPKPIIAHPAPQPPPSTPSILSQPSPSASSSSSTSAAPKPANASPDKPTTEAQNHKEARKRTTPPIAPAAEPQLPTAVQLSDNAHWDSHDDAVNGKIQASGHAQIDSKGMELNQPYVPDYAAIAAQMDIYIKEAEEEQAGRGQWNSIETYGYLLNKLNRDATARTWISSFRLAQDLEGKQKVLEEIRDWAKSKEQ